MPYRCISPYLQVAVIEKFEIFVIENYTEKLLSSKKNKRTTLSKNYLLTLSHLMKISTFVTPVTQKF